AEAARMYFPQAGPSMDRNADPPFGRADGETGNLIPAGTRIGRYEVRGQLGVGGMGVVYSAFDPELDRAVALKLLRADRYAARHTDAAQWRARLLREARAMARVAHPNVVAVHDVGEFDGQLFVAMELVEGRTLGRWLNEAPRGWPA